MQIKREEGGKNLPVHSCLRELQYNRQISRAGQAKTSKWQHLYLLENRDRNNYPGYLYKQGAINQSINQSKKMDVVSEVGEAKVVTLVM